MRVLTDAFASISKPGKGGAVRDVLTVAYPKLAVLLEGMFDRLMGETTMKVRSAGRGGQGRGVWKCGSVCVCVCVEVEVEVEVCGMAGALESSPTPLSPPLFPHSRACCPQWSPTSCTSS